MNPLALREYAQAQLAVRGLLAAGWTFRFDNARRRFGLCRFDAKVISVSRLLVQLNEESECRDTVLHEIAHALAGPRAGHGPRWKAMCLCVGADPRRCYDAGSVHEPPSRYRAECHRCGHVIGFHRRPSRRRACAPCCRRHAGGVFDERFLMRLVDTRAGEEVTYASTPGARAEGQCPRCGKTYTFCKPIRTVHACGACCRKFAAGRFDGRFRLEIRRLP